MASLIKQQDNVGRYQTYQINVANVTGKLWVLPHLAELAWRDSVEELNSFAVQTAVAGH